MGGRAEGVSPERGEQGRSERASPCAESDGGQAGGAPGAVGGVWRIYATGTDDGDAAPDRQTDVANQHGRGQAPRAVAGFWAQRAERPEPSGAEERRTVTAVARKPDTANQPASPRQGAASKPLRPHWLHDAANALSNSERDGAIATARHDSPAPMNQPKDYLS